MKRLLRCGEWAAGVVPLPSLVTSEDPPYRPHAMLLVEVETGWVVGTEVVHPDEVIGRMAPLFGMTALSPAMGRPRIPGRVRIADPALAAALRRAGENVEVVVAPTPEIDEVAASMLEHMRGPDAERETYLGPDTTPDDVAVMFAAAAELYRAAPWDALPQDSYVVIESPGLGAEPGAVCVVGQMGQSYGFSLFRHVLDAAEYAKACAAQSRGKAFDLPQHVMFSFYDRREMSEAALAEIAKHRWEVAGPRAYPWPKMLLSGMEARALTRDELRTTTEIMDALAKLVMSKRQELVEFGDGRTGGAPTEQPGVVHTVDLRMPWAAFPITMTAPIWFGVDDAKRKKPAKRKAAAKRR